MTMRARTAGERGETLVEFALALTLFLVTLLGTMEFGIIVFRYNMISDLAQEGARWASVRGLNSGTGTNEAAVQGFVASRSLGISTTTSVLKVNSSVDACTTTHVDPDSLRGGDGVCVKVQHTFSPLTRLIPLGTLTFSSTAKMVVTR